MARPRLWFIATALLLGLLRPLAADVPISLVATIKPVHSLLAAVTEGIVEPYLLLDGLVSPHQAQLKPSGIRALNNADVVVRVGPGLEGFLNNPLARLDQAVKVIELIDTPDLALLELRTSAEHKAHNHGHSDDAAFDTHIWTDPQLASVMVDYLALQLGLLDPENAERYRTNASAYNRRLESLNLEIEQQLAEVREVAFMVYHDSFQYFSHRYGLHDNGVVAWQPEVQPGASGLQRVLEKITEQQVQCLFSERQFPSRVVTMIVSESGIRVGTLDPLGSQYQSGPSMYPDWLRDTAALIGDCLRG